MVSPSAALSSTVWICELVMLEVTLTVAADAGSTDAANIDTPMISTDSNIILFLAFVFFTSLCFFMNLGKK